MELMVEQKYQQTELGALPEDWSVKSIAEVSTPVRGGSPRPAGDPKYFNGDYIPWLTVASLTNIPTSQMHVIETETSLTKDGSMFSRTLEVGTLIISNSGATLGVAKLLKIKCCANDGIAALLDIDTKVEPLFIAHYINSQTKRLREVIATGNGQPNLNTDLIGRIKIPLPPTREEQTAIATALSGADALIAGMEKLIEKKRLIKQGAMQELLRPKMGWVLKKLGECLTYEQPTNYLVKDTEYNDNNQIPVLTAGKTFILGYTDEEFGIFRSTPVIIFDDFTTTTKYVDFPFKVKSSAMKFLKPKHDLIDLRFIYESMNQIVYALGGDHKRRWIGEYQYIDIHVPPYEVQTKIAKAIGDMDAEIHALERKLAKQKEIKQGMMQVLLTGNVRLL
ncbi:MAG: restriction endonuclease subunit S [Flavipsychrobacter sp.]|nr:restriction endonuclease subunit S [Flavipsychrobacter sp.]